MDCLIISGLFVKSHIYISLRINIDIMSGQQHIDGSCDQLEDLFVNIFTKVLRFLFNADQFHSKC